MGIYETLSEMLKKSGQVDLVTVIAGEGSAAAGAKLLIGESRVLYSDLDSAAAGRVTASLQADVKKGSSHLLDIEGEGTHPVQVFVQSFAPAPRLVILGGGHVGAALCRMASMLDYEIVLADDRPAFASAAVHPAAHRLICDEFEMVFDGLEPSANDYIAIVTRGHRHDRTCLEIALKRDAAYIGMIGSRSRVNAQLKDLAAGGCTQQQLSRVRAPIGLSIGAVTEAEIALSILAEITAVRRGAGEGERAGEKLLQQLVELEKSMQRAALVTIVNSAGSVPRKTGSQLLVFPDGSTAGTIGGGCAEAEARREALDALGCRYPLKTTIRMNADAAADEGMACGGVIDIFIEPVNL